MRPFSIARLLHRLTKGLPAGFPDNLPPGKRRRCKECLRRARLPEQRRRIRCGNVLAAEAADIVGVPVRTLHERDRRLREGRLEPCSKRPHRKRRTSVTRELEEEIPAIRRALMTRTWGPLKIVAEPARRRGGTAPLPRAAAGRVVRDLKNRGRLPERAPGARRRRRRRAVPRQHAERRPRGYRPRRPGEMQMDTKHLTRLPGGGKFHQHDLYDPAAKYAASRITSSPTAAAARDALAGMLEEIPYPVAGIRTDNGPEYRGAFEEFLRERGIRQQAVHPRTPKQNAHVERFHGTVDDGMHNVWSVAVTVEGLDREIAGCIHHFNHRRPRQALGGRTPGANPREFFPGLPAQPAPGRGARGVPSPPRRRAQQDDCARARPGAVLPLLLPHPRGPLRPSSPTPPETPPRSGLSFLKVRKMH